MADDGSIEVVELMIFPKWPTGLQALQLDLYVTRRYAPWWSRWLLVLRLRWRIWRYRAREEIRKEVPRCR